MVLKDPQLNGADLSYTVQLVDGESRTRDPVGVHRPHRHAADAGILRGRGEAQLQEGGSLLTVGSRARAHRATESTYRRNINAKLHETHRGNISRTLVRDGSLAQTKIPFPRPATCCKIWEGRRGLDGLCKQTRGDCLIVHDYGPDRAVQMGVTQIRRSGISASSRRRISAFRAGTQSQSSSPSTANFMVVSSPAREATRADIPAATS